MNGIVTKYNDYCIFCGRPKTCEHHLIFGTGLRSLAEKDGLKVPACSECHNMAGGTRQIHDNSIAEKLSKMLGQAIWEKESGTREEFRKRYGRSYL